MNFWIDFIINCAIFGICLFIAYLILPEIMHFLFKNKTATYIYNKKDFQKEIPEPSEQKNTPELEIDENTGNYKIAFGENRELSNGIVRILINDQWYSSEPSENTDEKKLRLEKKSEKSFEDKLGKGKCISLKWKTEDNISLLANFYYYSNKPFIIFEQKFLDEIQTGCGKFDIPITQFPCLENQSPNKNIFTFRNGIFCPSTSKFKPTSGPVMHYDEDLQGFIVSSMNNFLVNIINETKDVDNYIACGLEGEVETIPKDYSQKFIIYFGKGINSTFKEWGDILLKYYETERKDPYNDLIISTLGYWTDNGAYYYYKTMRGKNYQETLETLVEYFNEENIPIRYLQVDSWFYKKSWGPPIPLSLVILMNGILDWSPNPKHFPDYEKFRENIGNLPLACHSRYFHPNNVYNKKHDFYISKNRINKWALPADVGAFDEMMRNARDNGIILYEQDWMKNQFEHFKKLRDNVNLGRKWLADMNEAAEGGGVWIQYCMATPAMFMHSLEFDKVSFTRTGNDYNARFALVLYYPDNSETAILAYSLGIWPFIDCFISNNTQGPFYKSPFPELLTVQAILSGGPVAPSDKINHLNKEILMRTCRDDGVLLKADKPATPIDLMFKRHSTYYITQTYSDKNGMKWYYNQIVNIWPKRVKNKNITLRDLEIDGPRVVYDFHDKTLLKLKNNEPIKIELKKNKFKLLMVAPILEDKVAVIGNPEKYVTCSNKQFPEIEMQKNQLNITIEDIENTIIPIKVYSEMIPKEIKFGNKIIKEKSDDNSYWIYNSESKALDVVIKLEENKKEMVKISY